MEHGHARWPVRHVSTIPAGPDCWSRAAAHRLAETLHARVPPPAQTLRTTGLSQDSEHGHACWARRNISTSPVDPVVKQSSSAPPCWQRCTLKAHHLRDAAHHRPAQDTGAWACLQARSHISTNSVNAVLGQSSKRRTALLMALHTWSPQLQLILRTMNMVISGRQNMGMPAGQKTQHHPCD